MSSRREGLIALAGPAANLLVAAVLFAIPIVRHTTFMLVVFANTATGLINLVPTDRRVNGRPLSSDGAVARRAWRTVRALR
jgi:hypothetical protein